MKKFILWVVIAFFSIACFFQNTNAAIPINENKTSVLTQNQNIKNTTLSKKHELKTEKFSKKLNKLFKDDPPIKKNTATAVLAPT